MRNYLNLANWLTILRILLIPVFAISLLYHYNGTALFIFCLAGLSDGLDGFIARTYGQKTKLGTFLDPMADMLLSSTAFIVMSMLDQIPVWLAVIVISRNVIIVMGSAIVFIINQNIFINTTPLGKATTFFQLVLIFFILFSHYIIGTPPAFFSLLFWVTAILTIVGGLQYIIIGTNSINGSSGEKKDSC